MTILSGNCNYHRCTGSYTVPYVSAILSEYHAGFPRKYLSLYTSCNSFRIVGEERTVLNFIYKVKKSC